MMMTTERQNAAVILVALLGRTKKKTVCDSTSVSYS